MRIIYISFVSLLSTLLLTYPTIPLFYEFFIVDSRITYILYSIVLIILVLFYGSKDYRSIFIQNKTLFYLYVTSITFLGISYLTTNNPATIREILTLTAIFSFITWNIFSLTKLIQLMCLIFFLILFSSNLVNIIFILDSSIIEGWLVTEINLKESNPILNRHGFGDATYYLIYYFTNIPISFSDTKFIRLPGVFTEPSYLAFYIVPLLIFLFKKYKTFGLTTFFIIATFFLGLILANSSLGNFILLFSIIIGWLFRSQNIIGNKGLIAISFSIAITVIIFPQMIYVLLIFFPDSKLVAIETMLFRGDLLFQGQYTLFGLNETDHPFFKAGFVNHLYRYGLLGGFLYLFWVIYLLRNALKTLSNKNNTKNYAIFSFSMLFTSLVMLLKSSFFIPTFSIFLFIYISKLQRDNS
jgi:hypothetical protein